MVDPMSKNPLDTSVHKAMMTPKVVQAAWTFNWWRPTLCKESHIINVMGTMSSSMIVSYIIQSLQGIFLILGSKPHTLKSILFFKNEIWWHDMVEILY